MEKALTPANPKHVIFSERNLERWAIFGTKNITTERVLKRKAPNGEVEDICRVGAINYNGRNWGLNAEHGRLMNLIMALFHRQKPEDNWINISSPALYDFLVDVASLRDPSRRKHRDSNWHKNYVHDLLYVLQSVPIVFQQWQVKGGAMRSERMNLIDAFSMYGKHVDARRGIIRIKLNDAVAAGLRAANTCPVLVEVANSIKSEIGFILYRYLDKVLAKRDYFASGVLDIAERLAITTKRRDNLLRDFRRAAKEMEGLDLTSGRIIKSEISKKDGLDWYEVKRGVILRAGKPEKPKAAKLAGAPAIRADFSEADKVRRETLEYLRRYKELPSPDAEAAQAEVKRILDEKYHVRGPEALGYKTFVEIAVCEVMAAYYEDKNNKLIHSFCTGAPARAVVARERPRNLYLSMAERGAVTALADRLRRLAEIKGGISPVI